MCKAIVKLLLPKYITFPNDTRLQQVMAGFLRRGFPQCAGAIDGTHIPVEAPAENASDYYNRKGWHSVILQGTVDHEGLFTDIYTSWPGRVHDARVFSNSGLYSKAESGTLLPNCAQSFSGVCVPCFVVGDPAYPLRPWLMKPFINTGCLTPHQQCFNNRLSKSRVVVEHAFGQLKGRWRCLRNKLSVCIDDVPEVIGAYCILHNLCQTHGEVFEDTWLENETEPDDPRASGTGNSSTSGENVRRALAEYLYNSN